MPRRLGSKNRTPIQILKARLDKVESINKELKDELKYARSMGNNNWRNNYELDKKVDKIIKHLRGRDLWTI